MIDARASYITMLNDPALDALLAQAQVKTAELDPTPEDINKVAEDVQEMAREVRAKLVEEIQAKVALRKEKVAIAVHMMKVASRLTA